MAFLQRRDLLRIISDHLPDKSKIHLSKRVVSVDHSESGVTVHCKDGSEYHGDIVVGADGVHSTIRGEMREHMEKLNPGSAAKDMNSLSAEYNCIFGMGDPVEGVLHPGDSHRSYSKDHSTLAFVGEGGALYWFLFSKLDKRYYGKDIPRYTSADAEEHVKPFFDIHMTDTIKFGKVWEKRTLVSFVCVEESQNEFWTADRFVCLGDSVHKVGCQKILEGEQFIDVL
jgi:2-polyprenyl-6-methoxyphenol hydroxylase-like FAD-dependent oxidoreductase